MIKSINKKETNNFFKYFFSYKTFKEIFYSIFFALIFTLIFQTFIYQSFKIPSGSMKPGLQIGDYLFVEKFSYGYNNSSLSLMLNRLKLFNKCFYFNNLKRGDVVVFLLPTDRNLHYIKRLIGLPGDEIKFKEGCIYINNISIKKKYIGKKILIDKSGIYKITEIFKETLSNEISYKIYKENSEKFFYYNFDCNNTIIYKVPKNKYFFIGDNRDNSIDSRFLNKVGYVSQNNIIGKAKFLFRTSNFTIQFFFKSS